MTLRIRKAKGKVSDLKKCTNTTFQRGEQCIGKGGEKTVTVQTYPED